MNNIRNALAASRSRRFLRVQRRGPPSSDEWAVFVMSGEHYPVLWIGRAAVVSLPAEIDITNADQVREDLLSVLNQRATLLVADLSATTFCDSAGVSALARAFRRAEASQSEMRLVVGTPAVRRVVSLTGIDRLLDIYQGVAAALEGPPDSGAGGLLAGGGIAPPTADTQGGAA